MANNCKDPADQRVNRVAAMMAVPNYGFEVNVERVLN